MSLKAPGPRAEHVDNAPNPTAPSSSFPRSVDNFADDPRVSFSKLDQKWVLENVDGSEFEWDNSTERWLPIMDEALLEQQRGIYAVAGVDESEPAAPQRKRKDVYTNGEEENGRSSAKKIKPSKEAPARKNTAVYVTNLPMAIDVDEVHSVFSKCGVIAEEIDGRKPRIKLYTDAEGNFKGEALIVYFRAESVSLAVQMLDETDFRHGEAGPSGKMKVQAADFSYKKQEQQDAPPKTSMKDKKKIIKKTQKLNNKLADWDDDDPSALQPTSSKWDKVVILKHMFSLEELDEDPAAMLEIKEDIRSECAKMGEVTNVVLFDKEPDGVASVRYSNEEAAQACVRMIDGRSFGGMKVEAYIADGTEKFKKASEKKAIPGDEDEQESRRLDQFGSWLEESEKKEG